MNDLAGHAALRRVLVHQYDELKSLLTRKLGSEDLAADALQETFLHLERPARIGTVARPRQYLLVIATNIARMAFRRERRRTLADLDTLLGIADDGPDPLRSLAARQEVAALREVIAELTPRRRRILIAIRIEGLRLRDLADELGLSQRMVEKELKAALAVCGSRLHRDVARRFGPAPQKASEQSGVAAIAPAGQHDDEV
ncbi:hypothetical protein IP86_15155 [Rhodopseudomonas sp. AAP120]|uniref:RNA polymerase sigma factor n=1 Tax=Rhodopseudomonas sp. AAP120 TaxID=1523430 RepID=UPI0006B950AC|nr:sigma-70 family RNA polymerase sigma factor [Rhodopseudomonas sp. AAP120]KPF96837.1 hypothetical protein IP86_15155 [Rhodopseudomonas sp. AAP120]